MDYGIGIVKNETAFYGSEDKKAIEAVRTLSEEFWSEYAYYSPLADDLLTYGLTKYYTNFDLSKTMDKAAYRALSDITYIEGNKTGVNIINKIKNKIIESSTLEEIARTDLEESLKIVDYSQRTVKGDQTELNLLIYVLRGKHKIESTNLLNVINELIQKKAITYEQGNKLLEQIDKMTELRLMLDDIKVEFDLTKEQLFTKKYSEDYFDYGGVMGFETYFAEKLKITPSEFKELYLKIISDNRSLITDLK